MINISEKDLESLFRQGASGSVAGFALVGRQLASKLKKTNSEFAARLASLLTAEDGTRSISTKPMPVDSDTRRNLVRESDMQQMLVEPVWDFNVKTALGDVIAERQKATALREAGLEPVRSIIFTGPPGVGKTLAAHWLGQKLNLPVLTLDLASVMSSLLGKTGSNIKSVIDYAKSTECILFLDEFDAIAKKRDDDKDVGELKRLVNVLLQAIDEWPSSSLLIAATNHPDMLDPAVWRRFEVVLKFDTPPAEVIVRLLELSGVDASAAHALAPLMAGQSYSDIKRVITTAKKKAVLNDRFFTEVIAEQIALRADVETGKDSRDALIVMHHLQGLSQRKIAAELQVSHPTVGKVIRQYREQVNG